MLLIRNRLVLLVATFLAVLFVHIVVIGGITVYHLLHR
jgi:hypothetical protein